MGSPEWILGMAGPGRWRCCSDSDFFVVFLPILFCYFYFGLLSFVMFRVLREHVVHLLIGVYVKHFVKCELFIAAYKLTWMQLGSYWINYFWINSPLISVYGIVFYERDCSFSDILSIKWNVLFLAFLCAISIVIQCLWNFKRIME